MLLFKLTILLQSYRNLRVTANSLFEAPLVGVTDLVGTRLLTDVGVELARLILAKERLRTSTVMSTVSVPASGALPKDGVTKVSALPPAASPSDRGSPYNIDTDK
jgi:hypothetical protein